MVDDDTLGQARGQLTSGAAFNETVHRSKNWTGIELATAIGETVAVAADTGGPMRVASNDDTSALNGSRSLLRSVTIWRLEKEQKAMFRFDRYFGVGSNAG